MRAASDSAACGPAGWRRWPEDEGVPSADSLCESYLDSILEHVQTQGYQPADAEDITSETLQAALVSLPKFRGDCSTRAWLLVIARQKMALADRRSGRKRRREQLEADLSERERGARDLLFAADPRSFRRKPRCGVKPIR